MAIESAEGLATGTGSAGAEGVPYGGVRFVGEAYHHDVGTTTEATMLTSLTGGIRSSVAAGDLVIAFYGVARTTTGGLSIKDNSGVDYTTICDIFGPGATYKPNLMVSYKFMGPTPDPSIDFGPAVGSSSNDPQIFMVLVFSGISPDTPLDVAAVTSTQGTSFYNPPAITPTTDGSVILFIGCTAHQNGGRGHFTPVGVDNFFSHGEGGLTYDTTLSAGVRHWTTSMGTFDPVAWVFNGSDTGAQTSAGVTIALRPSGASIGAAGGTVSVEAVGAEVSRSIADGFGDAASAGKRKQLLIPISDEATGGWKNQGNSAPVYTGLDKYAPDDTTYAQSPVGVPMDSTRLRLSTPPFTTGVEATVEYRIAKYPPESVSRVDMSVELQQNTTPIATWTHNDMSINPINVIQTLSPEQVTSITDYSDLYLVFTSYAL